jgi:TonB family protein
MISRYSLFFVLILTLLTSTAFATKKDAEATILINHAKELSDIRAEGAPAFRLKMSFKIVKKGGSVLEGSHTEVWISKTQWRRETVLGDFRETQIVSGRKRWFLDSSTTRPEHLSHLLSLTDIGRFQPGAWKLEKIADRQLNGLSARCLEIKAGAYSKSALCFDKTTGTIVADFIPSQSGNRDGETVCFYKDYQKFGDRVIARSYECDEDKHPSVEAKLVELSAAPATDSTFFTPPEGAKESVNCLSPITPPKALYTPDPASRTSLTQTSVVINIFVGSDGKPRDLTVISAPNLDFDKAALDAVRQWTFRPATCDGEAVEVRIVVEVAFHPSM